jgi:hypothetical protein
MHFSAASFEGGTLDWPRNGLIPKAPDQEPPLPEDGSPPQAQTSDNASTQLDDNDPRGREQIGSTSAKVPTLQPVAPRISLGLEGKALAAWNAKYGQTHNADGTVKTAAQQTVESQPTVSGTQPVTQRLQVSNQIQGGFGDVLRQYLPTDVNDNLYSYNTGSKVLAAYQNYNATYQPTTTLPTTPEESDPNTGGPQ